MQRKIILIMLVLVLAVPFCGCGNTHRLENPGYAVITYSYGEIYFREEMYGNDVDAVVSVLSGKREYEDNPACGFSEDISISINGNTYALACDSCGVVKNCTTGKYIFISDSERDVLEELFASRGGKFPCV